MNEFLNPKSMLTPGAAGSMVMLITNAICASFMEVEPRWAALILSFTFGAFVVHAADLKLGTKAGFWLVNSLIIFSVSVGTANVAAGPTTVARAPLQAEPAAGGRDGLAAALDLLVPAALAQERSAELRRASADASLAAQLESTRALLLQQGQLIESLRAENQQLREALIEQRSQTEAERETALREIEEQRRAAAERQAAEAVRRAAEAEKLQRLAQAEEQRAAEEAARAREQAAQQQEQSRFFKRW
ncbi:MAG: hypothetical protein ACLGI7_04050 [Gammaproteobacteria bacterium]